MRTLILETDRIVLWHHAGTTKFSGCQCIKDCSCNEDFISNPYDYYTVKKKFNKPKTTNHSTIELAEERIAFLNTIPITNNKRWVTTLPQ